ncbi:hypothetical protein CYMTET_30529 [Cymbomonas tetramitiformis]|uniref:Glutamine amidotransferase domain-containing protein n=1 Tax=Cymbomonas tetramitiformis TaxID=36881 RepID=A0AAE0FIU4_9CHLO|nr:hypothetical protein CYMTET_30529 [Cymbomonas tetramitiformis]
MVAGSEDGFATLSRPTKRTKLPDEQDSASPPLRLVVLNCPGSSRYDVMFQRWLGQENKARDREILWEVYEPAEGQLPPVGAGFDGYILSGSFHGVYEDIPWIAELCEWIRRAHEKQEKMLGICFGHQVDVITSRLSMMCQIQSE